MLYPYKPDLPNMVHDLLLPTDNTNCQLLAKVHKDE